MQFLPNSSFHEFKLKYIAVCLKSDTSINSLLNCFSTCLLRGRIFLFLLLCLHEMSLIFIGSSILYYCFPLYSNVVYYFSVNLKKYYKLVWFEVLRAVTVKCVSIVSHCVVSHCVFWLKFASASEEPIAFFIMKILYTEGGESMFLCSYIKFMCNT